MDRAVFDVGHGLIPVSVAVVVDRMRDLRHGFASSRGRNPAQDRRHVRFSGAHDVPIDVAVSQIALVCMVGRRSYLRRLNAAREVVWLACQHFLVKRRRAVLFPPTGGLAALVGVLGVTGSTSRLLDGLFNHGHDRVIRQATLTRTVVIQNVSKTQPALLHLISPDLFPLRGAGKTALMQVRRV
jgi:hypothetical protein